MKTSKKNYFKFAAALLFIIALALPTNMEALTTSGGSGSGGSGSGGSGSGGSGSGGSGSGGSGSGGSGGTTSIPLDGGLGILVLGAAAFGIKKLRGNKEDK
jgi:hypothetical protein